MLECKNLTYQYENGAVALRNIDFNATDGGIIGVIGSNGAGKSTLFKCLTGLVKPTKGQVLFNGAQLRYDKSSLIALRQRVNVVLQDPEKQIFFPRVFDDVAFGPRNLRWDESKVTNSVTESLEKMDLMPLKDNAVHYLSFGQKKRVSIAGILAMKCDMMILDEPEAGLDPQMKQQMIELMIELRSQGITIIVSSHNMDMMLDLCDTIYVLHEGELIGSGPVLEIMENEKLLKSARLETPSIIRFCSQLGIKPVKNGHEWVVQK